MGSLGSETGTEDLGAQEKCSQRGLGECSRVGDRTPAVGCEVTQQEDTTQWTLDAHPTLPGTVALTSSTSGRPGARAAAPIKMQAALPYQPEQL